MLEVHAVHNAHRPRGEEVALITRTVESAIGVLGRPWLKAASIS
jgi:hypothetical protein